jgi:predicted permease
MTQLLRDARHAVRVLASRPVLTATTIVTLALGIGGTSAMFSIASAVLLRPLPVPDAGRLVRIFGTTEARALGIASYPNLKDLADRAGSFAAVTIHQQAFAAEGLAEATTTTATELVSGEYFTVYGVAAARGRMIVPADDVDGAPAHVAVVSDRWWRGRLGGDPGVVGRVLHLNGAPFTVIGVAPPSFRGSYDATPTDMWVPLMTYPVVRPRGLDVHRRSWGWLQASARLAPGVTTAAARAEAEAIGAALAAEYPAENRNLRLTVTPASAVPESMAPALGRVLAFAFIVTALALLAACANVANAQLATVSDRSGEIAVRMAMGASRRDIVRLWLAESLVTTTVATGVGLLAAVWLRDGFLGLRPLTGLQHFAPAADLDWRVWVVAAALMALATGLSGVLPALRAAGTDPAGPLKDGVAATGRSRGAWLTGGLLSGQAAVSLVLVALAALLGRSVSQSTSFDLGFDPSRLVVATANTSGLGLDAARSFVWHDDTMRRVRALPGVSAASAAAVVPLGGNDEQRGIAVDGYTPPGGDAVFPVANNVVWPGYFDLLQIPVVRGRAFDDADGRPDAPIVAVVNDTMARTYWPNGAAVGGTIRFGDGTTGRVVGVVRDITYYALGEAPIPYLYLPFGPVPFPDGLTFHVRTAGDGVTVSRQLAAELRRLDPRVRVANAMSYEDLRAASLFPARAMALLSGGFGGVALLLLLAGTYGVTAYAVAARRREFALRVALGAAPAAITASVVRRAVGWGVPGLVAGAALALALARGLRSFLFGVSASDPLSLAVAATAVVVTAAMAAYLPARTVGRADLIAQLRR